MSMTTKKGIKSDINITPYIDILLTLLVIFMSIAPVRQKDLRARIPSPNPHHVWKAPEGAIVVSIGRDDEIKINRKAVPIMNLGDKLKGIYYAREDKSMYVRANPNLPYGDVIRVIDIAKGSGVGPVGLLTKPPQSG